MIKRILFFLIFLLTASLLFKPPVKAEVTPTPIDYKLPFPGILPDHPLYLLKRWRDNVLLFLTRNPVKKTEVYMLISDKNLVMGQLLWERNKYDLSLKIFKEGEQNLLKSIMNLVQLKQNNGLPPGLTDKIELAGRKHEEVIASVSANSQNQSYSQKFQDLLSINHQAIQQINTLK